MTEAASEAEAEVAAEAASEAELAAEAASEAALAAALELWLLAIAGKNSKREPATESASSMFSQPKE